MTLTGPQDTEAAEPPEASFEIEEGHFGPHLPRPDWELIFAVGGTALILVGFYLPWFILHEQSSSAGPLGPGNQTTTSIPIGGWAFATGTILQGQSMLSSGLLLLAGMPVLAALLALAMNIAWYFRRVTPLTCGVALSSMVVGLCVLFGETAVTLLLVLFFGLSNGNGDGPTSIQVGFGVPLLFLGYIGLAAATIAMCARYWRRDAQRSAMRQAAK